MTDHELLGLAPTATADELKARWQVVALEHHPDHGGDQATFMRLLAAYRRLTAAVSEPQDCPDCNGKGRVQVSNGFSSVLLWCERCGGVGQIG